MADIPRKAQEADVLGLADPAQEFLALLEPIKSSVERYALRSAWDREAAHDIVQEAVMIAWREFHRFERGTDFRAWMFRILVNSIFSSNKKTGRDRKRGSALPVDELDGVMARESAWASVLEEPERIMESLDERLMSAVSQLSVDEQQCLLLRLLEGFSYKEIASYLSMPMGTVMSHVHRARKKLREQVAALAVEHGLVREVQQ